MNYLKIKSPQRKNGYDYIPVEESKHCCIFEQIITPESSQYEVFIKKVSRERIMDGRVLPAREVLPSDEDFGKIAFSVGTIARAQKKMVELEIMCFEGKRKSPVIG